MLEDMLIVIEQVVEELLIFQLLVGNVINGFLHVDSIMKNLALLGLLLKFSSRSIASDGLTMRQVDP